MKSLISLATVFVGLAANAQNLSFMTMNAQGPLDKQTLAVVNEFCETVRQARLESQQCKYDRVANKMLLELIRDEAAFATSEKSIPENVRNEFKVNLIKTNMVLEKLK